MLYALVIAANFLLTIGGLLAAMSGFVLPGLALAAVGLLAQWYFARVALS